MMSRIAFHLLLFAANAAPGVNQINANEIPPKQILHPLFTQPDIPTAVAYATLSPFDTFHVAVNSISGSNPPLLADCTYFSSQSNPCDLTDFIIRNISACQP